MDLEYNMAQARKREGTIKVRRVRALPAPPWPLPYPLYSLRRKVGSRAIFGAWVRICARTLRSHRGKPMRNFYDVLGIDPKADREEVKDAFHSLAKVFHPDLNLGDEVAERRFREICQAYSTLKDRRTRAAYELGLAHQRRKARRRVSTAVMAGFTMSMVSTIVISLVMVWLLTDSRQADSRQASAIGEDGRLDRRETAKAPHGGFLPAR